MALGSHVLLWRQTGPQTLRLKSARRAPLQQYKRCVGIAVLLNKGFKMDRRPLSLSAWKPNLPISLAGEDVLIEDGATTLKSCLPSLEMCSPTAAGGLVPTGEASTATETSSNEPLLWFYATEEMNLEDDSKEKNPWTTIPSASYGSSSFWRLLAALYCYRVVETKSRQNRTFDPGGSDVHLHACPFFGSWRALVCGEVIRAGAAGDELQRFF